MSENGYSTLEIRVRAVEAVLRGQAKGDVAKAFGIDRGTLYRWVNRYQQDGDQGLRRKIGSGRPRKLK
jgi:transposase